MGYADWDIYGTGIQRIVDVDSSLRCELAGLEWILYNGIPALVDSEIIADIRRYGNTTYSRGGLLLRSDVGLLNCYFLERTDGDGYRLTRHVGGVVTELWAGPTGLSPGDWVRVRFRIDGWQLSVHKWDGDEWAVVVIMNDSAEAHASGHVGLFGANNAEPAGSMLFDNIEIAEKT